MRQSGWRNGWAWFIGAVLVALIVAPLLFKLRWGSYGAYDWVAYWSYANALFLGRGYFDFAWLSQVQRGLGYLGSSPIQGVDYPLLALWNPPPLLVPLLPFGAVDYTTATILWLIFNVALTLSSALVFNRALPSPLSTRTVILLSSATLLCFPALRWGQPIIAVAAFCTFAWVAHRRGRQWAAGVLLVPILLKPHLFVLPLLTLGLIVVRRRQWRVVAGAAVLGGLLLLAITLLDPTWRVGWLRQTPQDIRSAALWDIAERYLGLPGWFSLLGFPLLGGIFLWRYARLRTIDAPTFAEMLLLSYVLAPYYWVADVALILPFLLWLSTHLLARRMAWVYLLSLFFLQFPTLNPQWVGRMAAAQGWNPAPLQPLIWALIRMNTIRLYLFLLVIALAWFLVRGRSVTHRRN